jgi:hypothetical protein
MELSVTAGGAPEPDELVLDELPPVAPPAELELPPPQDASTSADTMHSQLAWSDGRMGQHSVWNRSSLPVSNGTAAGMLTSVARNRRAGQESVKHSTSLHPEALLQQT